MPRSRLPLRSWQSFKVTVPKCSFPLQISLLVTTHCPSKRYYSVSPVNMMLSLQEAASPSLGQGCRATQQTEPEVCCLFLRCPRSKLLAWRARASCRLSIVGIWLCFQLSRGAQPWRMLLGGSGNFTEGHRGKTSQFSTSYGLDKKDSAFLSLHLLHTCHDSPCHLSVLLRGRFP